MKAITLLEPWASLIAVGAKKIETRSWSTKYRGPLAIHAGKSLKAWHMNLAWKEPFFSALKSQQVETDGKTAIRYSYGSVIATCNLVDCIKMTPEFIQTIQSPELDFGEYAIGRYAWILENVKPLEDPIPAKGALSIWNWDGEAK